MVTLLALLTPLPIDVSYLVARIDYIELSLAFAFFFLKSLAVMSLALAIFSSKTYELYFNIYLVCFIR